MSPSSVCYTVGKVEHGDAGQNSTGMVMKSATTSFQFGIRSKHAEKVSVSALKVCKDSHRIRKPPLPLPRPTARLQGPLLKSPAQYRAPVIIHTYSPEVIYTQPDDFMSLVQKLTGSCDTRHRLKRKLGKKLGSKKSPRPVNEQAVTATAAVTEAVTALEQQLSREQGDSCRAAGADFAWGLDNCGSPSSSDDSGSVRDGLASVKQSNSPRGPLSNFEFDNTFTPSEAPLTASPQTESVDAPALTAVKTEPGVSTDSFRFFTGLKPLPKPVLHQHPEHSYFHSGDINSPLPSPGFLSPGWFAGLPELSPGTAAWSQQFLDCLNGSPQLANQPPLPRQRAVDNGAVSEGTMVALESIQAFLHP